MKEWFRVVHTPRGTTVTCTRQEDNMTVKYTEKCYLSTVKEGAKSARAGAKKALAELREAIGNE